MPNHARLTVLLFALATLPATGFGAEPSTTRPAKPWLGIHLSLDDNRAAEALIGELPKLAGLGVNVLVMEVNYGFEFAAHPELHGDRFLSRDEARKLGDACRKNGIRPIPQLNCLGHQSWSRTTGALLSKYPQFDETPGQFPDNKDIYCRSWCPLNPEVNKLVFVLMDELIEAFKADAFHVGMDEVFLIGSDFCPRCKGKNPADLFAKALNDYHQHLVGEKKVEMLMWADRLLDAKATGYGEWEAAKNGTAPAIERIPKDIVMCDWHYEKRDSYPSIPWFMEKGFRVWPCGWHKVDAVNALTDDALKHRGPLMLGYLCTTWGKARAGKLAEFPPLEPAMNKWRAAP